MLQAQGAATNWYLTAPALLVTALMGLLAVRLLLSAVLARENALMRLLGAVTNPVLIPVAAITPRVVPIPLVMVLAIGWLFLVRMLIFVATLVRG